MIIYDDREIGSYHEGSYLRNLADWELEDPENRSVEI